MSSLTPLQWKALGKSFRHGGDRIFYRDSGGGRRPILLLHGFPTASWDWHRVWPVFERRFRLIAPDFLGFGFSDKPRGRDYTIMNQARMVEALLESEGVGEADILAHDYGDTVAQEMLARFEDRRRASAAGLKIRSICFLNGGLFPETHRPRLVQRLLLTPLGPLLSLLIGFDGFARSFRPIFGPETQPSDEELRACWFLMTSNGGNRMAHRLLHYMPERKVFRERWVTTMQMTDVPLRVVAGEADPVSGGHMVSRYIDLVPQPDFVLLDGIGHYPQIEDPSRVVSAYLEFAGKH
ncbi:MAG: alpha/beta hydrolase [Acidobacteriota bacterium]|nr:MAG: alpha/beta hydrolase [Acidobacteriota bacterium]